MIFFSVFLSLSVATISAYSDVPTCPSGWERLGSKCFYFSFGDKINSFKAGESKCQSLHPSAHLASVTSQTEQDLIESKMKSDVWIGGTDKSNEGVWEWSDGSPWDYHNWGPTEPNNFRGDEDCLILFKTRWHHTILPLKWYDAKCDHAFTAEYVCSYGWNEPVCPPGWENLGDKCFYFSVGDKVKSFTAGESKCQSLHTSAHLASVTSQKEQDLIESKMTYGVWIGGNDKRKEGVWEWSDGSPWSYHNWGPKEPNNFGGHENCLILFKTKWHHNIIPKKWYDVKCNWPNPAEYVCSYNANAVTALELADGRKFFCHGKGMNREDAAKHCRSRGMALPIVKDLPTVQKIVKHCGIKFKINGGFWVDAVRERFGNHFKWSTSSVIDNKDPIWLDRNPSYDGPCVEFHTYRGSVQGWGLNDIACNVKKDRWVVCEQRPW